MKKILSFVLTAVLAFALLVPGATTVMAQEGTEADPEVSLRLALAIRAPRIAEAGQPVKIKVVEKRTHRSVAGVDVYAVKVEKIKEMLINSEGTTFSSAVERYVDLAEEQNNLIGTTDNNGEIEPVFSETGRYLLVAVKDGFIPGFARIGIVLSVQKALAIRVPGIAEVGQPVTIKVIEKHIHRPVSGAMVYALKVGGANEVSTTAEVRAVLIKADATDSVEAENYAALVSEEDNYIGQTDEDGKLIHKFEEAGRYVLVAVSKGYKPGFARIGIKPFVPRALAIKAPRVAGVNQPVRIKVLERNHSKPVFKAAVYAVKVDVLNEIIATANVSNITDAVRAEEYAVVVKDRGAFIDWTDKNGEVVHTFDETGRYILVAVKDGYIPGFARIGITLTMKRALAIKAPKTAGINQLVTMKVVERHIDKPVSGADVYAVRVLTVDTTSVKPNNANITAIDKELLEAGEIIVESDNITDAVKIEKYSALVREKGYHIGQTDENGEITHRFARDGRYILVAVKDGFIPGFARIVIRQLIHIDAQEMNKPVSDNLSN